MPSVTSREPYLITAIRQIIDLEAKTALTPDETGRLNQYRRWLDKQYPDVSGALVREYRSAHERARALSESMFVDVNEPQPAMVWHEVGFPAGITLDGAVVELCQTPDGTLTADLRIPAMQAPSHG